MFFKLALKNVRKSFRDYTLYFLTLSFSVCVFYVFNSIEAQKAMMSISSSTADILKTITMIIGYISIFVSFILGFLIVYANNFLIRRRKKEIGIYLTLGMKKGKVARMLVSETFLIGIVSLGAGLLAGIFLSQWLSVITANLFDVDMTGYRFVFSSMAFLKTVIYFGVIFIIVMFLSTVSISKYKLIDLINADKQNERQKLRSPLLTAVLFLLSVTLLGAAYALVLKNGIQQFNTMLRIEMAMGALGTFLFFASLSGFFLRLLQLNGKLYFKGLNMFVLRQINSRINTAHISMTFICLMLFCTIGILSTALGANNALNSGYKFCAPFDASFSSAGKIDIPTEMAKYGFDIGKYTDNAVSYALYRDKSEKLTKEAILGTVTDKIPDNIRLFFIKQPMLLIRLSDYNRLMELQGLEGITLSKGQVAVYSDYAEYTPELMAALKHYLEKESSIDISGTKYDLYGKPLTNGIVTSAASGIVLALVVPDDVIGAGRIEKSYVSFNCKGDRKSMRKQLETELYAMQEKYKDQKDGIKVKAETSDIVKTVAAGSKAIISFVGIYLGIIFLITSAAVLALQQLSEASDNRKRYNILQKIGADNRLINKALMKQIAIYFLLPLALACIHSIVGITVANDVISDVGGIDALGNIIITAVMIAVVYGSYFLATYFSSKQIVLKGKM
ncbi:MAG TPA: ABC transporter permease [Clostridia bacterium]|nr:ABC transporter permease [Clostridia bacterium]